MDSALGFNVNKRGEDMNEEVIYVDCPFCGEGDFDLFGLKLHLLNNFCDAFNAIDTSIPESKKEDKE